MKKSKPYFCSLRELDTLTKLNFIRNVKNTLPWGRYDLDIHNGFFETIIFHDVEDLTLLRLKGLLPQGLYRDYESVS